MCYLPLGGVGREDPTSISGSCPPLSLKLAASNPGLNFGKLLFSGAATLSPWGGEGRSHWWLRARVQDGEEASSGDKDQRVTQEGISLFSHHLFMVCGGGGGMTCLFEMLTLLFLSHPCGSSLRAGHGKYCIAVTSSVCFLQGRYRALN